MSEGTDRKSARSRLRQKLHNFLVLSDNVVNDFKMFNLPMDFFLPPSRQGKCKKKVLGLDCEVGMRKRTCYVLAGSVLSVWTKLGAVLSTQLGAAGKMQIIRLRLDDGNKIVGAYQTKFFKMKSYLKITYVFSSDDIIVLRQFPPSRTFGDLSQKFACI